MWKCFHVAYAELFVYNPPTRRGWQFVVVPSKAVRRSWNSISSLRLLYLVLLPSPRRSAPYRFDQTNRFNNHFGSLNEYISENNDFSFLKIQIGRDVCGVEIEWILAGRTPCMIFLTVRGYGLILWWKRMNPYHVARCILYSTVPTTTTAKQRLPYHSSVRLINTTTAVVIFIASPSAEEPV